MSEKDWIIWAVEQSFLNTAESQEPPCSDCEGRGTVESFRNAGNGFEVYWPDCPECGGKGEG